MNQEINSFIKKVNYIRQLGYVKAVNNDNSGIGLTFEKLIGKKEDNFPLPDYKNIIEIKTKLAYSKMPIHLFSLSPDGVEFCETSRLLNKYGYHTLKYRNSKVLNATIYANEKTKIGNNYFFSLKVDYLEEKIKLIVLDINGIIIDNNTFWTFNKIEMALNRKLKHLALIQAWSTKRNGINYYKYYKYNIYKFSNVFNFIYLIEQKIISITFSIGVFTNSKKMGKIHDHGTTFDINKEYLEKLFIKII